MEQSRFMDIYKYLDAHGFDVYSPGQKKGECKKPYIVVKDQGTLQYNNLSTTQTLYDLMCYVPQNQFTKLEPFVLSIREIMKGLYPMIIPIEYETPSIFDDSVKAYMISIEYRNMKQI